MSSRVLVAGIGNVLLRDDGFGPAVAHRLAATPLPDGVRVADYGIRGMHLAYDLLDGYDALVIVDTVPPPSAPGAPGTVRVLEVGADDVGSAHAGVGGLDAHGMDPVSVLANLRALGGQPPPTYVVGCEPRDVDEGIGLSPPVQTAVEPAVAAVRDLLDRVGISVRAPTASGG